MINNIRARLLGRKLYNDYKGLGLSPDDIWHIIRQNPHLTEAQLRSLLGQYTTVINASPKLVKLHGALVVFEEFTAIRRSLAPSTDEF